MMRKGLASGICRFSSNRTGFGKPRCSTSVTQKLTNGIHGTQFRSKVAFNGNVAFVAGLFDGQIGVRENTVIASVGHRRS